MYGLYVETIKSWNGRNRQLLAQVDIKRVYPKDNKIGVFIREPEVD